MDRATTRRWTTIKISTGGLFIVLILLGVFMLWRMAALRATLEYPESGLFLARAVVLLPMIACFLVAVWCFALTGIRLKSSLAYKVLLIASGVGGIACILFTAYCYWNVYSYYTYAGLAIL